MTMLRFIAGVASIGLVLLGVWWLEMPTRQSEAAFFSREEVSKENMAVRDELLALLGALRMIELDTSFFDDPTYRGLVDWSVAIEPQPVGRPNPFLPIGVAE